MTLSEKINAANSRKDIPQIIADHCKSVGADPATYRLTEEEKSAVRARSMR